MQPRPARAARVGSFWLLGGLCGSSGESEVFQRLARGNHVVMLSVAAHPKGVSRLARTWLVDGAYSNVLHSCRALFLNAVEEKMK